MQVYDFRAKEREKALRWTHNTTQADREEEEEDEVQEDRDADDEGRDTAPDGESWGGQEEEQDPENVDEVGEGWEQVEG